MDMVVAEELVLIGMEMSAWMARLEDVERSGRAQQSLPDVVEGMAMHPIPKTAF
jgi:hypothetical protein